MGIDIADRANMASTLQHRSYDLEHFEFRDDGPDAFTFDGVASVVDRPYDVRDQFGTFSETIRAGAFNKAVKDYSRKPQDDVFLYVNHRHSDVPMASRNAGTLKLSADPNLRANASLDPARPDVIIARSAVMRGEMTQMSVGFTVPKARDEWNADYTQRTIHEVNLREVSIVPIGANPFTMASMRSFDEFMESLTDMDLDGADMRRAIRAMEIRFTDLFGDEVRHALHMALEAKYNPSDRQYVWVRDFTDTTVIYELDGFNDSGCFQLGYTIADKMATLATADPIKVMASTTYMPLARAGIDPTIIERDRADRERLERKLADRIAIPA